MTNRDSETAQAHQQDAITVLLDLEDRLATQVSEIRAGVGEQAALGVEHGYHIVRGARIKLEVERDARG